jgi:hypothetical protein
VEADRQGGGHDQAREATVEFHRRGLSVSVLSR